MTKKKPVTIKEVAERCGVSRVTVSAVLHGKGWVSEPTRERVQGTLRDMRYQHHFVASSLSESFARMVGVVIGNIANPFNTELITALQDTLLQRDFFVIQQSTSLDYDQEVRVIEALEAYQLGGYVVAAVQEGRPHDHIRKLVDNGRPVVSIGEIPGLETHVVNFDDHRASKEATDYLLGKGHRRVACLAGPEVSNFAKHRIMGYVESHLSHGIKLDDDRIIRAGNTLKQAYETAMRVLKQPVDERPTAALCHNDLTAIGVYRAAYDLDLRIPDDLSVIGFDDTEMAAVMGPPLTTVATFPHKLGEAIGEILFTIFDNPTQQGFLRRVTQPELVVRKSVRDV